MGVKPFISKKNATKFDLIYRSNTVSLYLNYSSWKAQIYTGCSFANTSQTGCNLVPPQAGCRFDINQDKEIVATFICIVLHEKGSIEFAQRSPWSTPHSPAMLFSQDRPAELQLHQILAPA